MTAAGAVASGDPLNQSYYAATAHRLPPQPALEEALSADICVIGGGYTGLSAALAAAEAGYSVILLEAQTIGFGASGRNGGQLIPGLRWSARELIDEFGDERGKAIHSLAMTAVARVHQRIADHGIDCDLKSGHFEAAHKPAHFDAMRRDVEFRVVALGETGLEIVGAKDVGLHVASHAYHGGIYDRSGGHFHPLNYALGLARAALAAGVRIFEHSRVSAIDDSASVIIRTATGQVKAAHAILACDRWSGEVDRDLARYTVPIVNYNIATAPLADPRALLPSDAAVADSRFVLNYYRLSADGRLIFGGGEKYRERPPHDIAGFVRRPMVEIFPALRDVTIDYAWGGVVAVTMNRLPHFGRRGNCLFAHGFSGHGALLTTLAGELIVEALRGKPENFDLFANLPHHRFPGGRWLARPLATLGLLYYAMKDKLG